MLDVEDVGVGIGEFLQQPGKRPRAVRHPEPEGEEAARCGKAVPEQPEEYERVDVTAGEQCDDRRLVGTRLVQDGGDRGGTGRLDDQLGPFQA